jgi:hypothetical protein
MQAVCSAGEEQACIPFDTNVDYTVSKAINNNHQELLGYGLNKKNKQVMVAVSGNAGICISYQ